MSPARHLRSDPGRAPLAASRPGLVGTALLVLVSASRAAGGEPPEGLWWFGTVALLLVAGLSYALGRVSRNVGAAQPPATGAEDGSTLQALLSAAPRGLQVFQRDAEGRWTKLGSAPSAPGDASAGLPDAWREAAQALAPQSSTTLGPWTLQRTGHGAAERLIAWQHEAAPASAPAPAPARPEQADDAAREAAAFSYTVSHDLRAPLRVVEGFAKILKEDYGRQFDRIGNDHLDRVLAAAARMNSMIDAMLSLARLSSQPLARQPVDLSQIARYVVEDLRRGAPQRQVETTIEPGLKAVGDPTLLRLVLENLLSNAWKYSARSEPARISLHCRELDGRRVFEVRDNGAGFDMRQADRLFGLFQRLHSQSEFPGTGVGLASVQRIVRRHGGEIWAESTPGRGSCFSFTLAD
jgi:signal transduction histidine kinase